MAHAGVTRSGAGDLVRLNIEQIMKHPDYLRLSKRYRDFVETHARDIFTVQYDRSASVQKLNSVVALKEDPDGWLFWTGDLQKVNDELKDIAKRSKEALARHNEFLKELGLPPIAD